MKVIFKKYLNTLLGDGCYYATIVDIDEVILDGNVLISIKFASAEGFIKKKYLMNEDGLIRFYEDFLIEHYAYDSFPINNHSHLLMSVGAINSYHFDTHINLINKQFRISIELKDGVPEVVSIASCSHDYHMGIDYIKPYKTELDRLDLVSRIKDEQESHQKYIDNLNVKSSYGGLTGEEAENFYWNTN